MGQLDMLDLLRSANWQGFIAQEVQSPCVLSLCSDQVKTAAATGQGDVATSSPNTKLTSPSPSRIPTTQASDSPQGTDGAIGINHGVDDSNEPTIDASDQVETEAATGQGDVATSSPNAKPTSRSPSPIPSAQASDSHPGTGTARTNRKADDSNKPTIDDQVKTADRARQQQFRQQSPKHFEKLRREQQIFEQLRQWDQMSQQQLAEQQQQQQMFEQCSLQEMEQQRQLKQQQLLEQQRQQEREEKERQQLIEQQRAQLAEEQEQQRQILEEQQRQRQLQAMEEQRHQQQLMEDERQKALTAEHHRLLQQQQQQELEEQQRQQQQQQQQQRLMEEQRQQQLIAQKQRLLEEQRQQEEEERRQQEAAGVSDRDIDSPTPDSREDGSDKVATEQGDVATSSPKSKPTSPGPSPIPSTQAPGVHARRPQHSQAPDQQPCLDDKTLSEVAKMLGPIWVTLAVELGSTMGQIQTIEKNHQNDITSQGVDMLVTWKQAQSIGDKHQITTLFTALKKIGRADIAGFLNEVHVPRPHRSQTPDQQPCLDDKTLHEVATRLGCDWENLALELGFTTIQVQTIEKNHHNDIIRQGLDMLVTWKQAQSTSDEQQITTLCTALKKIKRADIAGFLNGIGGSSGNIGTVSGSSYSSPPDAAAATGQGDIATSSPNAKSTSPSSTQIPSAQASDSRQDTGATGTNHGVDDSNEPIVDDSGQVKSAG